MASYSNMTLLAIIPIQRCDITRLWVAVTILAGLGAPFFVWASRQRWQFTLRQLLLLFPLVAVGVAWTRKDLVAVVSWLIGTYPPTGLKISWRPVADTSPLEMTAAVLTISLIFTFAFRFRRPLH